MKMLFPVRVMAKSGWRWIVVVGSRVGGTADSFFSDFDYIIEGANAKIRSAARRSLPRSGAGGEINSSGVEIGIDILDGPLDPAKSHMILNP